MRYPDDDNVRRTPPAPTAPPEYLLAVARRKELEALDHDIAVAKKKQELQNVGREAAAVAYMHSLGYYWLNGGWYKRQEDKHGN